MKLTSTNTFLRQLLRASLVFLTFTLIVFIGLGILRVILSGYSVLWTGFGDFTTPDGQFLRGKTFWDWMELLIIPFVLAGVAYYLNRSEKETERRMTINRQREASLQSYFDRMGELFSEKGSLTFENAEARNIARIRTLSVLRELDGNRKRMVLLFLKESNLISLNQRVSLSGADLINIDLSRIDLSRTNLKEVDLSGANLLETDLSEAFLEGANLSGTNLSGADLRGAELSRANLSRANLRGAKLQSANLTMAKLKGADLRGANLRMANISGADLSRKNEASLEGTFIKKPRSWDSNETLEEALKKDILIVTSNVPNGGITSDDIKHGQLQCQVKGK